VSKLVGIEPGGNDRPGVVELWREKLDGDDKAWFDAAIKNPNWGIPALLNTVRTHAGADFGEATLARYRKAVSR
jgi:hypothetical protein